MKWINSSLKPHIKGVNFLVVRIWDNKMAIQQRDPSIKKWPGVYCFPGGAVEHDETPDEAVARECREETGIAMIPADFLHIGNFAYLMDSKLRVNSLYLCFVENPMLESKEGKFHWMSMQQIKHLSLARNENVLIARIEKFILALRE